MTGVDDDALNAVGGRLTPPKEREQDLIIVVRLNGEFAVVASHASAQENFGPADIEKVAVLIGD